jgi:hypothetical protein
VLCIDIEPDDREVDRRARPRWTGFEQLVPRIPELRDRLSELTGSDAHFVWGLRMDHQIANVWGAADWAAVEYENELRSLLDAGDELGLHTHSWRWSHDLGRWVVDNTDAWVRESAEAALATFRKTFGRKCAAHRFGDRFLSDDLVDILTKAEVTVDLTIEPGFAEAKGVVDGELGIGTLPDTRGAPRRPYRPGPDGFLTPDPTRRDGPLLVPLTDALVIKSVWSDATGTHLPRGHSDVLSPIRDTRLFHSMLDRHLANPAAVHVAMAVRSDRELGDRWHNVVRNLEALCWLGTRHGLHMTTASEAARLFDECGASGNEAAVALLEPTASGRAVRWWEAEDDRGFVEEAELHALDALSSEITALTEGLQREQIDAALLSSRLADKEEELARVVEELIAERDMRRFAEFHLRLLQSTKMFRVVAPFRRAYGAIRSRLKPRR